VHGLLNTVGVGLFTASFVMRRRRARAAGRFLSALGTAVAMTSARLGGHLVYSEQCGVDHAAGRPLPEDFTPVLAENELAEGRMRRVEHQGTPILLARQDGQVFALVEICSHLGGPLSEGTLGPDSVQCPWHGSCFALHDGRVLNGPAVHPQPRLEVRIRDGRIEVRKPQATAAPSTYAVDVQPVPDRP
jgi:nitrite reductase/ring-hydroxylating ferredoxin subunit